MILGTTITREEDMRAVLRSVAVLISLATVQFIPAVTQPVAAYNETGYGCIVARDPDIPGQYPNTLLIKLSDGTTQRFDLSRFNFKRGDSLNNDECYRMRYTNTGGGLFLESFDRDAQPSDQTVNVDTGG